MVGPTSTGAPTPTSTHGSPSVYSLTDARPGLRPSSYTPPASIPRSPAGARWVHHPAGAEPAASPPTWPPPGGAPWSPPRAPAAPRRSTRVARTAMGLAVGGAVLSFVPLLSLLSGPLLLAAAITAIVALASRRQGAKGMAASALVLSAVAWIVSAVIAVFSWFGGPADSSVGDDPVIEEPYVSAGTVVPLVDSAFGPEEYDPSAWWFAAVLDTPASHQGSPYLDLTVEAVDDTGAVIDTSTEYIEGPQGRIAVAGAFYGLDGRDISSIVVRAGAPTDLPAEDAPGAFTVGALDASAQDGRVSVTGVLTSSFASVQSFVRVVVLARGPDGAILDVATTWLEEVPPGDQGALVEAQFFRTHPPGTTYEAHVSR